jgi:hypothetical protein
MHIYRTWNVVSHSEARKQTEIRDCCLVECDVFMFRVEEQQVPPKCRYLLRGFISWERVIFTVTAVRSWRQTGCDVWEEATRIHLVFVPKRRETIRGWRKLHYEQVHNLYSFQYIISMSKSWRIIFVGHVARTGEVRSAYRIVVGKSKRGDGLGVWGICGRIILKRRLVKKFVKEWTWFNIVLNILVP